jgi:hypothetical protein
VSFLLDVLVTRFVKKYLSRRAQSAGALLVAHASKHSDGSVMRTFNGWTFLVH